MGARSRDFWLYWAAGVSDNLGTAMSGLALPLFLLATGYSPGAVGAVVAVTGVIGLLAGPAAAVLADRDRRRPMMIGAALVAGVAMAVIAATMAAARLTTAALIAALLVERIATSCYAAAAAGTLTRLLAAPDYARAVARIQAGEHGSSVVGPALAGTLFALARWSPFAADAVSYLLAALCIRAIRADLDPVRGDLVPGPGSEPGPDPALGPDRDFRPGSDTRAEAASPTRSTLAAFAVELGAGLREIRAVPVLRFVLIWTAGVSAVLTGLFYLAVFRLGGTGHAGSVGAVLAGAGAAGLIGSALAPALVRRVAGPRIVVIVSWLVVPVALALARTDSAWAYGGLLATASLLLPAVAVVLQAQAVLVTDPRVLARVGTALQTAAAAVAVLMPAVLGVLVSATSVRVSALACALCMATLAMRSLVAPRLWAAAPGLRPATAADQVGGR